MGKIACRSTWAARLIPLIGGGFALAVLLMVQPPSVQVVARPLLAGPPAERMAPPPAAKARVPALGVSWPVVFTGKDHVDLKWDLLGPPYVTYKVIRDGDKLHPVATFDMGTTFYRDYGVNEGETHTWMVCAYDLVGTETCGWPDQSTVGNIAGWLYQDLTWSGDEYGIFGTVYLTNSATLAIGQGALVTVTNPSGVSTAIDDNERGVLRIVGATIQANVTLRNHGSVIAASTVGPSLGPYPRGSSVTLDGWGGSVVAGNVFTAASLHTRGQSATPLEVTDNTFHGSRLQCFGQR